MTLTLRYPTTLATLEIDETYSIYLSRKPKMPKAPVLSPDWMILGHTHKDKWVRHLEPDYKEAVRKLHILQGKSNIRDVCLFSRRKTFKKPTWIDALAPFEEWCGRCRRPTLFQTYPLTTHHALPGATILVPDQKRCFFCGIRQTYFSDRARTANSS
jgi:hypothetical protein